MRRAAVPPCLPSRCAASAFAQDTESSTAETRLDQPDAASISAPTRLPEYKDPRLRGLVLALELSAQPVKFSEVRQLEVKVTLTNVAKHPITLEFPNDSAFEIYLRNSAETVLTTWSDNHAFADDAGTVLINPAGAHRVRRNDRDARTDAEQSLHRRSFFPEISRAAHSAEIPDGAVM